MVEDSRMVEDETIAEAFVVNLYSYTAVHEPTLILATF